MIRTIQGEYVIIGISAEGVTIRAENQVLTIHDETWRELVQILLLIHEAAKNG